MFEYIKKICDETEDAGLFWLTGSESRKLIKNASDSLAGRICILRMYSLSLKEKLGVQASNMPYTFEELVERETIVPKYDINQI